MDKLTFIAAVYNEESEIDNLISHVYNHVDEIIFVDDGSIDRTAELLDLHSIHDDPPPPIRYKVIEHTGLPETVKNEALKLVDDRSWVLMLDADERFEPGVLNKIQWFLRKESEGIDYVYFDQVEFIDNRPVRNFQKCKLFRKEAITFPLNNIHADDEFTGFGRYFGWGVRHRKTTDKQVKRELEYLETYQRLFNEGKIDEGRLKWLQNLHHYVKP